MMFASTVKPVPSKFTNLAEKDPNIIHVHNLKNYPKAKAMLARITVYSRDEKHGDRYTRKGIAATGKRLVNKKSCAVDPSLIPYGSKVVIPQLHMVLDAVDTGSAVKNKTASKKTGRHEPVVDVFFDKNNESNKFVEANPKIVEIYVIKN